MRNEEEETIVFFVRKLLRNGLQGFEHRHADRVLHHIGKLVPKYQQSFVIGVGSKHFLYFDEPLSYVVGIENDCKIRSSLGIFSFLVSAHIFAQKLCNQLVTSRGNRFECQIAVDKVVPYHSVISDVGNQLVEVGSDCKLKSLLIERFNDSRLKY